MSWYVAPFRQTTDGGSTRGLVYAPDGTALGPVPTNEYGKPLDANLRPKQRRPGIVWQRRGKVARSGWDHYWVWGDGREYLVIETDVTGGGQTAHQVVQRPQAPTPQQQAILASLGLPMLAGDAQLAGGIGFNMEGGDVDVPVSLSER